MDSSFLQRVYREVAAIPSGKVATYGQIAALAGAPQEGQEVGRIMSRCTPEMGLPCHRVVNRTGALSPDYAFGGQDRQRRLLEAEGIGFTSQGRIDMVRYQWRENEQLTF